MGDEKGYLRKVLQMRGDREKVADNLCTRISISKRFVRSTATHALRKSQSPIHFPPRFGMHNQPERSKELASGDCIRKTHVRRKESQNLAREYVSMTR
jgi:hypothetical protein